jgi:hypothetical protein
MTVRMIARRNAVDSGQNSDRDNYDKRTKTSLNQGDHYKRGKQNNAEDGNDGEQ